MLLNDGEYGCLVKRSDEIEIANSVVKLIEDKELAIDYGKKAQQSLYRFGLQGLMKKWNDYVEMIVNAQ